jgi:hypothetical protein
MRDTGPEQMREVVGWERTTEVIALGLVTLMLLEERQLVSRFDAFGNDP